MMPCYLMDSHPMQRRQNILLEHPPDLVQRTLPPFFQHQFSTREPLLVHHHEGVLTWQLGGLPLVLAMDLRIDAFGDQPPRFFPQGPRVAQADLGIRAQGYPQLLAQPVVPEVPSLATFGG